MPPEDEVNPSKVSLMAWTHASGQLNPDRGTKYLIFQQNSQNPKSVSILIIGPSCTMTNFVRLASSILIESEYFSFRKKILRTVGRPILLRMNSSFEP